MFSSISVRSAALSKSYLADSISTYQGGSKTVDSNTTYRIGSVTKLFTVYTFLTEAGDTRWNDPIPRYVPELLQAAGVLNATENPIDYVAWEDIAIGDLAREHSGIGRGYAGFGELDSPYFPDLQPSTDGLPKLNATEVPIRPGGAYCNRQQFFTCFMSRYPVYAPATAPIYSNAAYMVLSYALENVTGINFSTSAQNSLFTALNLSNGTSSFKSANINSAIIPTNAGRAVSLATKLRE